MPTVPSAVDLLDFSALVLRYLYNLRIRQLPKPKFKI